MEHQYWLKFESFKGFLPIGALCLLAWLGYPAPAFAFIVLLSVVPVWFVFVAFHDMHAAHRMQQLHAAYLERENVDTNLSSVMSDKRLWKQGLTFREFVALRRRTPAAVSSGERGRCRR